MNQILFISPVPFAGLQQRHQALARELAARNYRVFYVDPIKTGGFSFISRNATSNLEILELRIPFKKMGFPALQRLAARFALLLIENNLQLAARSTLLWVAEPSMAWLCQRSWSIIVYDRCDLHGSFPGQNPQTWQNYEKRLFTSADLIVCSHPFLQKTLPHEIQSKSMLAGNACAEIFFSSARRQHHSNPPFKLVSSGAHYEWVDCSWLSMISSHPDIELHLAGSGRGNDYQKLRQLPQVIDHGQLDQAALAALLAKCDVGLVPFKNLDLIKGVDPVKVYEYAASGLEVWAPPLDSLRKNGLISRVVANRHDLEQALKRIAVTKNNQPVARWTERLQTILDRLTILTSD